MLNTRLRDSGAEPTIGAPVATELAAETICDQHGAALFALASVLVSDRGFAEAAVVNVISAGFPATSMAVPMPVAEMRRHLAKRVYLSCGSRPAEGKAVAAQEQTALALTHYGHLTYRAVADLLGLSGAEVARCLESALRRGALGAQ
ncbi:hypothetical protein [Kribbella sp. CA-293567]|uniref:hypothetical protein n=1 Tax=Kribbella sp. CA-293567 TaxID=3002436 RepID=UPI0022DE00B3|nr:hypothetical protein [Kribbella sp. CA-293567]WBQ03878.1 hypothetical protein OX958_28400 [Kribbella sp. CA-293567]